MKECRTCKKEKNLGSFYCHSRMLDGHLNICIDCTKTRIKEHRNNNLEKIRAYDRSRRLRKNMTEAQIKKINEDSYERDHFGWNRAKVLKRDNYTCQKCGSKTNKLCVHHIDGQGRRSEEANNKMSNLQTLCIPCHSRLHSKERIANGYVPHKNPRGANGQYLSKNKELLSA